VDASLAEAITNLLREAAESHKNRNFKHSRAIYEDVLSKIPGQLQCLYGLSEIFILNKKYAEAKEILVPAVVQHPSLPLLHKRLGDALTGLGEYEESLKAYDQSVRVLSEDETSSPDKLDAASIQLACSRTLQKMGKDDLSGALIMNVLKEDEQNFEGLFEYGCAVIDRGRAPDAVAVFLRLLVETSKPKYKSKNKLVGSMLAKCMEHPTGARPFHLLSLQINECSSPQDSYYHTVFDQQRMKSFVFEIE
jgi:tetratricopeptide (TPR) repeat protein